MSAQSSTPGSSDQILVQFLKAFEEADQSESILADFEKRYPALADEFRSLASANRLLDRSQQPNEPELPTMLGEFRIVRPIAKGGMGEIYEAFHERLQRRVAVKIIRQGRASPISRERFLREQRVLAQLHQTHIVPIHTAGEEGPLQYFAMPHIQGAALSHVVKSALAFESSNPKSKTPSLAKLADMVATNEQTKTQEVEPAAGPAVSTKAFDLAHRGGMAATANSTVSTSETKATEPSNLNLSSEYFRSVAQVVADAAEAIEHAHRANILHRDIKPSNIMVDGSGQCWIIDFGLAAWLNGESKRLQVEQQGLGDNALTVSGLLGTPQYMAPEQCTGKADVRTDVWGLGVTLYELLTLRRAFDGPTEAAIRNQILSEDPARVESLVPNAPPDLTAICRKALQKDAMLRYSSTADFAADLRRWLRHEPTVARPARTMRRLGLWSRRNKGWAAAIAGAVLAIVALSGAGIFIAEARTSALKRELADAEERERLLQRESLIQKMIALRMGNHWAGWSDEAWSLAYAAAKIKKDEKLRDQYAATLQGMDARKKKTLRDCRASGLLFDAQGKRLLLGGTSDQFGNPQEQARIWDSTIDQFVSSGLAGDGPVVFRPDGVALQFVPKDLATFQLWDIAKQSSLGEFAAPGNECHDPISGFDYPAMCISPDGSLVAASCRLSGEKSATVVWDASTRKVMRQWPGNATALLFALDKSWLAIGDGKGDVHILSLATGKELALLQNNRTPIHGLAHGRDCLRRIPSNPARRPDLKGFLAVGDDGGGLIVWDLTTRMPRTHCRGSHYEVLHIAFSPDGATFASCGRDHAKIWDVRTGRVLLRLPTENIASGVAYSPNGKTLAIGNVHTGQKVDIWQLETSRGIDTMAGLTGQVTRVFFSQKGDRLAALTVNWELGIWDLSSGNLLHLLEVSPGLSADNAALAFSEDERYFAFCSGREASFWDLQTGRALHRWKNLPPGLCDNLAFTKNDELLLIRSETRDGAFPPYAQADPVKHPRVCRVRNLKSQSPLKPLHEIVDFRRHISHIAAPPDGSYFVVDGRVDNARGGNHVVKAFDTRQATVLWSSSSDFGLQGRAIHLADPAGKILYFMPTDDGAASLIEFPSGRLIATSRNKQEMSPDSRLSASNFTLWRQEANRPLLNFDLDLQDQVGSSPFNSRGTHLVWGKRNGNVLLCSISEVQRRLAGLDLGW
jgi:serine/threonine protein kinase/WD40 repeat protein